MSALVAKFEDFSKGDAGYYLDKRLVGEGYFQGENVMVYKDGAVGPRSGVISLGGTSIPAGVIYDIGYVDMADAGAEYVWIHKGTVLARNKVYDSAGVLRSGQAWAATTGAFAAAPTNGQTDNCLLDARVTAFTLKGDKSYKCGWDVGANGTLTALAGSPGGACIAQYREFLVVANLVGNTNRVKWSAPGNFASWPAANFFDLGGGVQGQPEIKAMKVLRDQLLIWTELGALWIVTGRLGTNQVVKQFMPDDEVSGPGGPKAVGRTRDGAVIWGRREFRSDVASNLLISRSATVPIIYTGGARTEHPERGGWLQDVVVDQRSCNVETLGGRNEASAVMFGFGTRALVMRGAAWSRHTLGVPAADSDQLGLVCSGERGEMFSMGNVSNELLVWWWEADGAPSAFAGDNTGYAPADVRDPGSTAIEAYLATPEFRHAQDYNVIVDRVDVLITSHPTGSGAVNNHFAAYVQSYDALSNFEVVDDTKTAADRPFDFDYPGGDVYTLGGASIDLLPVFDSLPPGLALRQRISMFPADKRPAPAIRVLLRDLHGVSIRSILVYGSIVPTAHP